MGRPLIDRTSPVPLWAQIAERIRTAIASGEYADMVPPEEQLARELGVSRHTVRQAVVQLQREGVVRRERGRGTFVVTGALEGPVGSSYSLARAIESGGLPERSEVLTARIEPAGGSSVALGLADDDAVVHIARLRFAGDHPLALDRSWLPARMARRLLRADLTRGSLYEHLRRACGVQVTGGRDRIRPIVPTGPDRSLLELPRGEAAFDVERTIRAGTQVVELRRSIVRGDRYSFVADWSLGSATASGIDAIG